MIDSKYFSGPYRKFESEVSERYIGQCDVLDRARNWIMDSVVAERAIKLLEHNFPIWVAGNKDLIPSTQHGRQLEPLQFIVAGSSLYGGYPDGSSIRDIDIYWSPATPMNDKPTSQDDIGAYVNLWDDQFERDCTASDYSSDAKWKLFTRRANTFNGKYKQLLNSFPVLNYISVYEADNEEAEHSTTSAPMDFHIRKNADGQEVPIFIKTQICPTTFRTYTADGFHHEGLKLVQSFDFAHCQVGAHFAQNYYSGKIELTEVFYTNAFVNACLLPQLSRKMTLATEPYDAWDQDKFRKRAQVSNNMRRTFYIKSDYPELSLYRLKKFYDRGMYGWGPQSHNRVVRDYARIVDDCLMRGATRESLPKIVGLPTALVKY